MELLIILSYDRVSSLYIFYSKLVILGVQNQKRVSKRQVDRSLAKTLTHATQADTADYVQLNFGSQDHLPLLSFHLSESLLNLYPIKEEYII